MIKKIGINTDEEMRKKKKKKLKKKNTNRKKLKLRKAWTARLDKERLRSSFFAVIQMGEMRTTTTTKNIF